jgi:hypothetical protein
LFLKPVFQKVLHHLPGENPASRRAADQNAAAQQIRIKRGLDHLQDALK